VPLGQGAQVGVYYADTVSHTVPFGRTGSHFGRVAAYFNRRKLAPVPAGAPQKGHNAAARTQIARPFIASRARKIGQHNGIGAKMVDIRHVYIKSAAKRLKLFHKSTSLKKMSGAKTSPRSFAHKMMISPQR
jgi:hypothetical protein